MYFFGGSGVGRHFDVVGRSSLVFKLFTFQSWEPAGLFPGFGKLGTGDESPPAGSSDGAPVGAWGQSRC